MRFATIIALLAIAGLSASAENERRLERSDAIEDLDFPVDDFDDYDKPDYFEDLNVYYGVDDYDEDSDDYDKDSTEDYDGVEDYSLFEVDDYDDLEDDYDDLEDDYDDLEDYEDEILDGTRRLGSIGSSCGSSNTKSNCRCCKDKCERDNYTKSGTKACKTRCRNYYSKKTCDDGSSHVNQHTFKAPFGCGAGVSNANCRCCKRECEDRYSWSKAAIKTCKMNKCRDYYGKSTCKD